MVGERKTLSQWTPQYPVRVCLQLCLGKGRPVGERVLDSSQLLTSHPQPHVRAKICSISSPFRYLLTEAPALLSPDDRSTILTGHPHPASDSFLRAGRVRVEISPASSCLDSLPHPALLTWPTGPSHNCTPVTHWASSSSHPHSPTPSHLSVLLHTDWSPPGAPCLCLPRRLGTTTPTSQYTRTVPTYLPSPFRSQFSGHFLQEGPLDSQLVPAAPRPFFLALLATD